MNKLIEIKNKVINFYGEYEAYIYPAIKFVLALIVFLTINANIGYMSKISSFPVALVLALVCALLPINGIVLLGGIVILLDMYALSMEVAAITFVLFVVIYCVYFRFAPKDGIGAVITPILYRINIPYVMPVATGLLRKPASAVSIACGTIVYYYLEGIARNASALAAVADDDGGAVSKFNVSIGQLLGNKEMYIVIAIFALTTLVVNAVKKIKADYAWTIAIVSGTLIQLVCLLVAYLTLGLSDKMVWLIIGTVLALLVGFVLQFIFMQLDYARTERVQFEDDEYYYYVKAVPKKMIASEEKVVKHFGNTSSMGKRIPRENEDSVNKADVAREFNIDKDML